MISDENINWLNILPWKYEKKILKEYSQIIKHFTAKSFFKSKIYIKPQEEPPEGAKVQRGPRGGMYYEDRQVMPKRPLSGHSAAVKPTVELSANLLDIPEITSFYSKYLSEKTAFGQLMACYDIWEWFKTNRNDLSEEQQKSFNQIHFKLNSSVRKLLIQEINGPQEKKIDYAKKYHFYPEAFGCTENELPLVSDLMMKGMPINKLDKIDDKYKVTLECGYESGTFFKFLSEKEILDWKCYWQDFPGHKLPLISKLTTEDLASLIKDGKIPRPGIELILNTSTGTYIFHKIEDSNAFNIEFSATEHELKHLQTAHFKSKINFDEFLTDISRIYTEAEIGSEEDANSWCASWLSDSGGFAGTFTRLLFGIKNSFSFIESNAVSFAGGKASPASSVKSLSRFATTWSESKVRERFINNIKQDFSGVKRLYKDTQSFLETDKKYKKKDTITVYRGIGKHTGQRLFDGKFDKTEVWVPPISSWTESTKIAKSFAQEADGNVLTAEVPKSWILAHWKISPRYQQGGFYNPVTQQYRLKTQKEITIMSPENKIKCSKITYWKDIEKMKKEETGNFEEDDGTVSPKHSGLEDIDFVPIIRRKAK